MTEEKRSRTQTIAPAGIPSEEAFGITNVEAARREARELLEEMLTNEATPPEIRTAAETLLAHVAGPPSSEAQARHVIVGDRGQGHDRVFVGDTVVGIGVKGEMVFTPAPRSTTEVLEDVKRAIPEFSQGEFKCLGDLKRCEEYFGGMTIGCGLLFILCVARQLIPFANLGQGG